jgi:two-component system sensor histidine kinase KdpD
LRKTSRLADRFHAPWYAVYVQTPRESMEKIDAATHRNVLDQLALAQQLGGISMQFLGDNFAKAVSNFVKEYGITHIMLGRSRRPWYRRWFGQSPLDQLIQAVPEVDVTVIDTV